MYRHKKVGDAVIVDLGSTTKSITSFVTNGQLTNVNPQANGKTDISETFVMPYGSSSINLGNSERILVGVCLPKLGRDDNISISFSGTCDAYTGGEHEKHQDVIRVNPFIAVEGTTPWDNSAALDIINIKYLPSNAKFYDHSSVNALIVAADLGYGQDLTDKGICVGFSVENHRSTAASISELKGTINARYNYAPIKTLDMEV